MARMLTSSAARRRHGLPALAVASIVCLDVRHKNRCPAKNVGFSDPHVDVYGAGLFCSEPSFFPINLPLRPVWVPTHLENLENLEKSANSRVGRGILHKFNFFNKLQQILPNQIWKFQKQFGVAPRTSACPGAKTKRPTLSFTHRCQRSLVTAFC